MRNKLQKIMQDQLAKEILTFFFQNQSSVDSVSGISTWVRNEREVVEIALEELVKLGVVEEDSTGSAKGYSYTRDTKTMEIVKKLMSDV